MTEGETRFYLREISSQWSTSNVSPDKLAELEAARLIEINAVPFPTVRLTNEGTRWKMAGRPQQSPGGLPLIGKPKSGRHYPRKKVEARAKPLE